MAADLDHLMPTTGLRFIERAETRKTATGERARKVRILQQRFLTSTGGSVWRDVPMVTSDDE
ncbi:hypothetical protein FGK63_01805 [Ruegeria sediminis]|uniref:Transposase n=1 Tax=Ruegeria sediminis TaxID=2583820 RepID=A0ABY2X370_9RHOB|nr:hypothetical protein [Ruegeria sediminis]TMV09829.1 hypothetical protein FGK63_01805 [Ruegeria sediminis]